MKYSETYNPPAPVAKVKLRNPETFDKAINGARFQIGNNRGRINGWIGANGIYEKCIKIED